MHIRHFAAASFVALAALTAGGAQAAVVLHTYGATFGDAVDSGSNPSSFDTAARPGSLSFMQHGIVSIGWFQPTEGAPSAALSRAPVVEMAADLGGDHAAAKPILGGDGDTATEAALPDKLAAVSGLATVVTEVGGASAAALATLTAPVSGSQTKFVVMLPPAPTDWQDFDNHGVDTHNIAAIVAAQVVSAVPEPASWALMLVGFGGMGALLRRRQPAAA